MKHTNKKGFTIVELVIVIAVIAILAAVLIPTFSNLIKKANQSSDIQLIRNLNNAVAAAAKEDITIAEAIAAAATFDIAVDDIEAKAKGNKILWDDVAKVFCYLNGDTVEYISNVATAGTGANLWIIDTDGDTETDAAYSSYVLGVAEGATINAKNGIDVTGCPTVTVNYAEAGNVNIYTKASDTLVINNAGAEVDHYGAAALVDVKEAAPASYHAFANIASLRVTKGNVVVEAGAKIQILVIEGENVSFGDLANNATIALIVIDADLANKESDEIVTLKNESKATVVELADPTAEAIVGYTTFAGGNGSAENPYIIETAQQLMNIGTQYEVGYFYYKVKDGVTELDCAGWPKTIKLNGSFDGNGVTLKNLSYALFNTVGYKNEADTVVLKNFTANLDNSSTALVRNVFNSGKTTFENIVLNGTIVGAYNLGSFYNYGTANYNDTGANYEVDFVNAKSYLTIIDTTGNTIGGMLGHHYCGAGNVATINMDANSGFFGVAKSKAANSVAAIIGESTINGASNTKIAATAIETVAPVAGANGFTVKAVEGAAYYVVSVNAQVTSYDAEGNKIPNASGLTFVLDSEKVTNLNAVVLGKVNSVKIVNETLLGTIGYTLENGVLNAYVGDRNALSGTFTLFVTQYDAEDNVIALGSYTLDTIAEPTK